MNEFHANCGWDGEIEIMLLILSLEQFVSI